MANIKVVHDAVGNTLTVWLDDPAREHTCEEPADDVVVIKDAYGRVIGFELLHYASRSASHERIAAVLRFAQFEGPTGDIERILSEIDQGRG